MFSLFFNHVAQRSEVAEGTATLTFQSGNGSSS